MTKRYGQRRIVKEKSCGIIRQIRKQDELAKELERSRIEKETLMEYLIRKEKEEFTK
ncbi:hypothetical protein FACS1894177_03230 [Bacteroidia bacterium]|nr:hypothetical protein FACS1894177_03230 [Bacteroidia bacterium]